jgi:DnaD/phage-associated family protein
MQNLGSSQQQALSTLKSALASAVERGTLLQTQVKYQDKSITLYFLNNQPGQDALQAIKSGKWQPFPEPNTPITLDLERPNIFRLYEQHIGPLTPILAETLQDAEKDFPPEWIVEALLEAVKNNVRKWTYVEAILRSWQEEGKHARRDKKHPQEDRQKYLNGKVSDAIEH